MALSLGAADGGGTWLRRSWNSGRTLDLPSVKLGWKRKPPTLLLIAFLCHTTFILVHTNIMLVNT